MAPSMWSFVKRSPSTTSSNDTVYHPRPAKMAAGLLSPGSPVSSTASSLDKSFSPATSVTNGWSSGYDTFLSDVLVVGAGPSGVMLANNLVRYGIKTQVIDNRPERTLAGRADGLQPKTIETLRQMRLAEPLLRKGVKVYDIAFWKSTLDESLRRTAREIHYPPVVDLIHPYILLVHQGIVEGIFVEDLAERGVEVIRNTAFVDFDYTPERVRPLTVTCKQLDVSQNRRRLATRYIVGCDGAHSAVRKCIPNATPLGASSESVWGVLDGVIDTNFPDIWSKVIVHSDQLGSILMLPRERNLTRLYVELKPGSEEIVAKEQHTQEFVQKRAQEILRPYKLEWRNVEWFGRYQVGQRVASRFTDKQHRVFIAGDASHTHSPKAAQGMNVSMHDSWNLAWKLNFAVRNLAKPALMETYQQERKKIAHDLIDFDYEHANAFGAGDPKALAENFKKNIAFISGYGVSYDLNVLNVQSKGYTHSNLSPGYLLPPAKVTRFIDANPVDIQTDIPALGQFRIYFFTKDVHASLPFLDAICQAHRSGTSYVSRVTNAGNASYTIQPPLAAPHDQFVCPERYTPVSGIFTYAIVTDMNRNDVEIAHLPRVFQDSRWTFYLDDVPHMDTRRQKCMDKWLGGLAHDEVVVVNVRPDGYVGTLRRWVDGGAENGEEAVCWLDDYYSQFLRDS